MFKSAIHYITFVAFIAGLSQSAPNSFAQAAPSEMETAVANVQLLSETDLKALTAIAGRKGVMRLAYDKTSQSWSYFGSSYFTKITRYFQNRDRFDVIAPLEELVERVEQGYWHSTTRDPEVFHLIRRAYASLSSLYSFYKINPSANREKQAAFIERFSAVLVRFKFVLLDIESKIKLRTLYKPLPWEFGEIAEDITEDEKRLGLHYVELGERGLSELNQALAKTGNVNTTIERAMEFYPRERTSFFALDTQLDTSKKYAIFIIHGTFSAGAPEYKDDSNLLFQQTKYMAQSFANQLNFAVEVYSFGWSGKNSNEDRMIAGEELENFVRTYFPAEEYHDIFVGHSHGGNVALHCAKTLREYRTPYMIVTLATPIRKDFITDNVNYLFQYYTDSDWVQWLGSFEILTDRNRSGTGDHEQSYRMFTREDIRTLGLFAHNDRYERAKIYATKVHVGEAPISGALQSHTELRHLIGILPAILDRTAAYPPHSHLSLSLDANLTAGSSVRQMERTRFKIHEAKP